MNPVTVLRGLWGSVLLARPQTVMRAVGGAQSPGVRTATRVLGARHVIEALIVIVRRDRTPPRWPLAIDAVHVLSMLGFAAASPRLRRDALTSAAMSSALIASAELERRGG